MGMNVVAAAANSADDIAIPATDPGGDGDEKNDEILPRQRSEARQRGK